MTHYVISVHSDAHSQDQATSQKQRLSKELGLTVGNVNLSDDLFNDEDLIQSPTPASFKTEEIKRVCNADTLVSRSRCFS